MATHTAVEHPAIQLPPGARWVHWTHTNDARSWSERGDNFDDLDFRATWRSIKPGAVTQRTLFKVARDAGWSPMAEGRKLTKVECGQRDTERALLREIAASKQAERGVAAASLAERVLSAAELATNDHPYLLRKGVPAYGLKIGSLVRTDHRTGEAHTIENALLIPIRDTGKKTHSIQYIFPDDKNIFGKDRVYLAGGVKQGNFFAIGQPKVVDGKKTIVIVEGYATGASVHKCTGNAVIVAFDKSNLEPVAKNIRELVPDADLVIIGDRDAAALPDCGGTKAALKAAVAACARIVVPDHCGLDGRDANDIDLNGFTWGGETYPGPETLRGCVKFATPFGSPAFLEMLTECGIETDDRVSSQIDVPEQADAKPETNVWSPFDKSARSLVDELPGGQGPVVAWAEPVDPFGVHKPPHLPLDVLPRVISAYAADQASLMGIDPAFIAMPALAAAASMIHDGIKLQPKRMDPTWLESARLWVALVGDPSTLKSPAIKKATCHVQRLDASLAEKNQAEYAQWVEKHDRWKVEKKMDGDAPEPKAPPKRRMIVEDATTEALSEVLKDNERGILCLRDELAGWQGSMDAYKGGGGQDRAAWLETYNGGLRLVDRVQRGSFRVPNWSVCMVGGIQPDTMRRLANNMGSDGLLQRFMPIIAMPTSTMGQDRAPDREAMEGFSALFDQLASISPEQQVVTLTEAAHLARERVERQSKQMSTAFDSDHMRAYLGKWNGLFARLVLTFHVIECAEARVHPTDQQVSGSTAEKVELLMCGTLLHHAIHFYTSVIDAHDRHEHIRQLARLILAKGWARVTNRDIAQQWKAARKMQTWEVRASVESLVTMGWLEPDAGDLGLDGKPRSWVVNPAVHQTFALHAAKERARRKEVVETMKVLKETYSPNQDGEQEAGN